MTPPHDALLVRRAFLIAHNAHQHQRYGEDPYLVHLFDVYNVMLRFGHTRAEVLAAALLHDVLEDTPMHYSAIDMACGREVAEIVYACTDQLGRNRRERKHRSLQHLAEWTEANGSTGLTVKLADWIANVEAAVSERSQKLRMYQREWPDLRQLRDRFPDPVLTPMWHHLEELLRG